VLAVKPQQAAQALQALYPTLLERKPVVLSIAAGLRLADLARACPPATAVVRAMPNRPALLGAGVTGLYAPAIGHGRTACAGRTGGRGGRPRGVAAHRG
jgi:pyrroline-5-carboxylate reductase